MEYILVLDQGTTSSRTMIIYGLGNQMAIAQREFKQHFPKAGWVEHDADEIWSSQLGAAKDAISQSGLLVEDIAAIGITNQRETTLLWERDTGKPVCRAIVGQVCRLFPCSMFGRDGCNLLR